MGKFNPTYLAIIGVMASTAACQKAEKTEYLRSNDESKSGSCQEGSCGQKSSCKAVSQSSWSVNEDEFYKTLSSAGKKKFMEMDLNHRHMAIEMTQQINIGQNACAGMGGCKSAYNSCAGKNSCRGQGGMPVRNPNKAVLIQHLKQTGQR